MLGVLRPAASGIRRFFASLYSRVPVLDGNGRLRGILSMNDVARHGHRSAGRNTNGLSGDSIVQTLAVICEPHAATGSKESAANGRTHHSG